MAKKAVSVLCALTLSVGMVPSAAFASEDAAAQEFGDTAPMLTGDGSDSGDTSTATAIIKPSSVDQT